MVLLAQSSPGCRSTRPLQIKEATVMLDGPERGEIGREPALRASGEPMDPQLFSNSRGVALGNCPRTRRIKDQRSLPEISHLLLDESSHAPTSRGRKGSSRL